MKTTQSIFILSLAISLLACNKKSQTPEEPKIEIQEPTACFSPSTRFIQNGDSIKFENCSENYEKVEWFFGDGENSSSKSPSHTYKSKGIYKVSLKAHSAGKTTQKDTSIACGMKASAIVTLNFSNWNFSPEIIKNSRTIVVQTQLYKQGEPNKLILNLPEKYSDTKIKPYLDKIILTIPLANENDKYFIKASFFGIYLYSEGCCADYAVVTDLNSTTIENINIFNLPRPSGSKQLDLVKIDYSVSETIFE